MVNETSLFLFVAVFSSLSEHALHHGLSGWRLRLAHHVDCDMLPSYIRFLLKSQADETKQFSTRDGAAKAARHVIGTPLVTSHTWMKRAEHPPHLLANCPLSFFRLGCFPAMLDTSDMQIS